MDVIIGVFIGSLAAISAFHVFAGSAIQTFITTGDASISWLVLAVLLVGIVIPIACKILKLFLNAALYYLISIAGVALLFLPISSHVRLIDISIISQNFNISKNVVFLTVIVIILFIAWISLLYVIYLIGELVSFIGSLFSTRTTVASIAAFSIGINVIHANNDFLEVLLNILRDPAAETVIGILQIILLLVGKER